MDTEKSLVAPPPPKRRQSILKSGNSSRPDETECIDITTGLQKLETEPAATVPPRRVSFFEIPQILDISPAQMSSDDHSQASDEPINKTFACNVSMEMSTATGNPNHMTVYDPVDMSLSEETGHHGHLNGELEASDPAIRYIPPAIQATIDQLNKTLACNVPMEMSMNDERMPLYGDTNKTLACNVPMEMSINPGHMTIADPSDMSVSVETANSRWFFEASKLLHSHPAQEDETTNNQMQALDGMNKTFACNVPMEMSSSHPRQTIQEMDMSLSEETSDESKNLPPSPTNSCPANVNSGEVNGATDCTGDGANKTCARNESMDISTTKRSHLMTVCDPIDMSLAEKTENLNLHPAPPQQWHKLPQKLVHPTEISARPNVLPPKFQPARTAQLTAAAAPNLVNNSQYVDFMLRNPTSTVSQKASYPARTCSYGQFGSAKTPRRNYEQPVVSHPQQFETYAPSPPKPLIEKVVLNSVEVQTSPLTTTYVSTGTSITPREPQQKTPRCFLPPARRDFGQQAFNTPDDPQSVEARDKKEEVKVFAPVAAVSLSRNLEMESHKDPCHEDKLASKPPAAPAPPDPADIRRMNQRRRETYTVQKPVFAPQQHIQIDGREVTTDLADADQGIQDTSNVSYASTLSSFDPEPDRNDDTRQIQGQLLKSINQTESGTIIEILENSVEDVRCGISQTSLMGPPDANASRTNVDRTTTLTYRLPPPQQTQQLDLSNSRATAWESDLGTRFTANALTPDRCQEPREKRQRMVVSSPSPRAFLNQTFIPGPFQKPESVQNDQMKVLAPAAAPPLPPPLPPRRHEDLDSITGAIFKAPRKPTEPRNMNQSRHESFLQERLDASTMSIRDPQHQLDFSFRVWEVQVGQKTRHYLKNYTTMSLGTKAQHWLPITDELLKLDRGDFERFAEDFVHVFPDWFMSSVRAHFEMQELFAVPFNQYDSHPTIMKIIGGLRPVTVRPLEELLQIKW